MDESGRIAPLSVKAAAQRLGLSEYGTRGLIASGQLTPVVQHPSVKVSLQDVEALRLARRDAAVAEFTRRGVDMVKLAQDVRRQLRPELGDPLPGGVRGLSVLPPNVRALFGPGVLMALTLPDREACGWCAARVACGMLRVPEPQYGGEVFRALLGRPCAERCMPRFAGAEMAKLRARVHPGGTTPSAPRAAPVTASGSTAPPASPVPRGTPAQPVQPDDSGRALVAARLRAARARLKNARRSGDTRYALKLRAMVASLEQDAAQVDGRAVTAAARTGPRVARFMGDKACGTPVGTPCSCHPGPKRGAQR